MPTAAATQWEPSARLMPKFRANEAVELPVRLAQGTYVKGQVLGELLGNDEIQHIAVDATGGTFAVTYGGVTSAPIAYNATVGAVQTALDNMTSIGPGNSKVSGSASAYDVEFIGALGYANVVQMTADSTLLTGNTHTATMTTGTGGGAGTKGTFAAYKYSASDGTQIAKCVLQYPCTVDAQNNITMTGEWPGVTDLSAPAYFTGIFDAGDLVGLDQNALTQMGGKVLNGVIGVAGGTVQIG